MHSPKVKIAPSSKSDESSQASLIRTDLRYLISDENNEEAPEAPRNLVSLLEIDSWSIVFEVDVKNLFHIC